MGPSFQPLQTYHVRKTCSDYIFANVGKLFCLGNFHPPGRLAKGEAQQRMRLKCNMGSQRNKERGQDGGHYASR